MRVECFDIGHGASPLAEYAGLPISSAHLLLQAVIVGNAAFSWVFLEIAALAIAKPLLVAGTVVPVTVGAGVLF
jgi:hypothetical protein